MAVVHIAVLIHTLAALATDLAVRRIPNPWNAAAAAAGLALHGAADGWQGLSFSAAGCAVLFLATVPLQLCGAIGGGDVKWFAALGSWTGAVFALQTLLYAILAAGVMASGYFLLNGSLMRVLQRWLVAGWLAAAGRSPLSIRHARERADRKEMPFMAAVLPAVLLAAWQNEGSAWLWVTGY